MFWDVVVISVVVIVVLLLMWLGRSSSIIVIIEVDDCSPKRCWPAVNVNDCSGAVCVQSKQGVRASLSLVFTPDLNVALEG